MKSALIFLLLAGTAQAAAVSCKAYVVMGVYKTQAECEQVRRARIKEEPNARTTVVRVASLTKLKTTV